MFDESYSSGERKNLNDSSDQSHDSEAKKFEKEHNVEAIFHPEIERDKIVISVIDSGIGIKRKDKIKLFKLFGCLNNTR